MTTQPMAPADVAWFHIDGPVNLAQVTGIVLTRKPLDFARVKAVFSARLRRFRRFRQRVVERGFPIASPCWEDVPDFAFEQQLLHVALPAPHDQAALADLVSDLAATPLDRERPLWQAHVVDGVGSGSALVIRIHHCLGDGTAMMAVIRHLFDATRDAPVVPAASTARASVGSARTQHALAPALDAIANAARDSVAALGAGLDAVMHPQQALAKAATVLDGIAMLAGELFKAPDPASPLKGAFGMKKRVAWSEPVALDDVKAIGAPLGAKINDVLVAAMTGALRTYLRGRHVDVNRTTVRAMVPVDLRPPERVGELGNEFGLVILDLPVRSRSTSQRLRTTKARMDALKRSPEAPAILLLFNLFGRGPKAVEDFAVDLFGSKASLVMTNVAGPRKTLYVAGVPIDRLMFWVPHPGRQLGMGVSILSYRGAASLAVIADARLVPDPEAITREFNREFARMLAAARRGGANPAPATTAARRGGGPGQRVPARAVRRSA
jgi:diacylglycerol O-acyltransferase / wax synthase